MNYILKDSGERVTFESGFNSDIQDDKPRYDLIPPELLKRLAEVYARGSKKYGRKIEIPINLDNVYGIIGSICKHQKGNIQKSHFATPKKDTQLEGYVLNAIPHNTRKLNEPIVTLIELDTLEDCVEYVMTNFLSPKTQSTLSDKKSIMQSGLNQILKDCVNTGTITVVETMSNFDTTAKNENDIFSNLALPGKMNIIYNKSKEKYVLYASIYQAEPILISTTTTIQTRSEDFFVDGVIRDLDSLVTISKELNEHLSISQIHQSIELNYESKQYIFKPDFLQNWQLANTPEEYQRFIASGFRHFEAWRRGEEDEDHAMQACWNIIAYEWHKNHKNEAGNL
jgi:hypothetical protein